MNTNRRKGRRVSLRFAREIARIDTVTAVLPPRLGLPLVRVVLVLLVSGNVLQPLNAAEPHRVVGPVRQSVRKEWDVSLRKCPPLKRRDEARISLDKDGKLVVWTSRGTREATLDAKKREELLDAACACFADFTFNFPYSEASDSERVELSLKSGRRSLQIHLSEYIGETNLKLIAQMQRFSDLAQPDSIKVRDDFMQKSAEPELSPVWGRWQASLEIDRGVRKKTFVSIHDDGAFMIHKTDDSAVPEPRNELLFSGSLATREKESLLRETLESFSQFTFDHDTAHLDGEISITLGLQSGRDRSRARTLMIREQGLRADELSKSFIAPLVAIVNARTPEAKHVPLE